MKKVMFITVIGLVAILALSAAGFAYAQTQTPPTPATPNAYGNTLRQAAPGSFGPGMMGGFRSGRQGMFRWSQGQSTGDTYGPLRTYLIDSMAKALGLPTEQLETRLQAGDTAWQIAQEKGWTAEQFSQAMIQARTEALNQAVADGVLTQDQADAMLERMDNMWAQGFGPGSGNCTGTGPGPGGRRGPGFRWNNQLSQ